MKSAALCALLISVVTQMGVYAQTKMYGVNVTNQAPASSATLALNDENTVSLNLKFNFSASNDLLFDVTAKVNDSTMPGTAWLKWKNHGVTYELSLDTTVLVFASSMQTSNGSQSIFGLLPQTYRHKRMRRAEQSTHFDAATTGGGGSGFWTSGYEKRIYDASKALGLNRLTLRRCKATKYCFQNSERFS